MGKLKAVGVDSLFESPFPPNPLAPGLPSKAKSGPLGKAVSLPSALLLRPLQVDFTLTWAALDTCRVAPWLYHNLPLSPMDERLCVSFIASPKASL